jgi:XTP/dITP diphosphohydrolase
MKQNSARFLIFQFITLLGCGLLSNFLCAETAIVQKIWTLNTSNEKKRKEFHHLFAKRNIALQTTCIDLREIDADPMTVVIHKASQMPDHVLVEDTSLEIEGINIGINLRTLFGYLMQHIDEYIGKKATWTVLLAYKERDRVFLYKGSVAGVLVPPKKEDRSNFDAYFLPEGSSQPYISNTPDDFNARALAVRAFAEQRPVAVFPVISEWTGPWQICLVAIEEGTRLNP